MGTPFPTYYDDATNPTPTNSAVYYDLRIGTYKEQRTEKKKILTKKEKQQIRASRLHKSSFVVKQQMKPNVFKTIGYPFKSKQPKSFYL